MVHMAMPKSAWMLESHVMHIDSGAYVIGCICNCFEGSAALSQPDSSLGLYSILTT